MAQQLPDWEPLKMDFYTYFNDPKKHPSEEEEEEEAPCSIPLCSKMASTHGHQNVSEKAPHFFKFLLDDNIQRGKLMIPQSFTRKHGKDISDTVLLRVPSGGEWQVKLTKCDTGVWSLHGLQEFMEYYSLQLGYFLLFQYQGKSNFWVIICDTSASEIEYPLHDTNTCVQEGKFTGEPSQVSEMGRTRSIVVYSEKHKRKSCSYDSFEEEGEGLMAPGQSWLKHDISGTLKPLVGSKKSRALQMASSFKSKNPFFVVFMQPSYVRNEFRLNLPVSFSSKYFLKDNGYLNLHGSNGGPWRVKYNRYNSRANISPRVRFTVGWKAFAHDNKLGLGDVCVFELNKGIESSLQVVIYRSHEDADSHDFKRMKVPKMEHTDDDVVKLEKPKRKSGSNFQQDLEEEGKKRRLSGVPRRTTALSSNEMATSLVKPKSPFFALIMQPSYVIHGSRQQIPSAFVHKYFPNKDHGDIILWDSNGRTWPVKYVSRTSLHSSPKIEFIYGWKEFMQEHDLEVGDTCVFELIDSIKFSLKVTVSRVNQYANHFERKKVISKVSEVGRSRSNGVYSEKHKRKSCSYDGFEGEWLMASGQSWLKHDISGPLVASKKSRALQMAYSFKSKNPFFLVFMQPSYVSKGFRLNLPMCFITKYLLKDHGYLNLHGSNGGPWHVKYIRYNSRANNSPKVEFTVGWKAFAQDNKLGVGDVCVFELNKGIESSLQVVIYRSHEDADSHDLNNSRQERIGEHRSEYPFFHRIMCWSYLHCSLTVPRSFAMKYIKERSCTVQLQVGDKSWVVKSRIYEDGSCKIIHFSPLARENRLQEGDVCIFQLIKSKDMVFKVSIVRYIG